MMSIFQMSKLSSKLGNLSESRCYQVESWNPKSDLSDSKPVCSASYQLLALCRLL